MFVKVKLERIISALKNKDSYLSSIEKTEDYNLAKGTLKHWDLLLYEDDFSLFDDDAMIPFGGIDKIITLTIEEFFHLTEMENL